MVQQTHLMFQIKINMADQCLTNNSFRKEIIQRHHLLICMVFIKEEQVWNQVEIYNAIFRAR